MALKLLILGVLRQEEAHGYRIAARLAALAGTARRIEPARVYETLGALEREGAIASRRESASGRERRTYATTESGSLQFERWLARPVPSADWLRRPLLARLAVAGPTDPGRTTAARSELDARRRARARCATAMQPHLPGLAAVLDRAARTRTIAQLDIEIEMLEAWLGSAPAAAVAEPASDSRPGQRPTAPPPPPPPLHPVDPPRTARPAPASR